MHSLGILHRDLKTANVLANNNCQAKLCDFGLARLVGTHHVSIKNKAEEAERLQHTPNISSVNNDKGSHIGTGYLSQAEARRERH